MKCVQDQILVNMKDLLQIINIEKSVIYLLKNQLSEQLRAVDGLNQKTSIFIGCLYTSDLYSYKFGCESPDNPSYRRFEDFILGMGYCNKGENSQFINQITKQDHAQSFFDQKGMSNQYRFVFSSNYFYEVIYALPRGENLHIHDFSKGIIQIIVIWNDKQGHEHDPKYPNCLKKFFEFE